VYPIHNYSEPRKFLVPEFIIGNDCYEMVDIYVETFLGRRVMIVTDPGVIEAGWADEVIKRLKIAGVEYTIFSDLTPNPKDYEVMKGVEIFNSEGCDMIIAVGGGSPMDCAKGIGISSTNMMHVLEFEGVDQVPQPAPPLICIPTTAGTAADISQFAIITDSDRKVKIAIVSKTVIPDISLISAKTTTTMSDELTAATGIDALVHAFEAYVSNASSPITDLNAIRAIDLVFKNLLKAIENPLDLTYRNNMMLASTLAGMAFSNASLGIVHAMAHSLGGFMDLPHGECNALLLENAVEFNYESSAEKYNIIGRTIGIRSEKNDEIKHELIDRIRDLRKSVGITQRLSDMGVKKDDIGKLAGFAIEDPCVVTNPVMPEISDLEKIYEKTL